ncbi:MAG: HEAT repeat domain-containing protein [Deltaproteobacteria bacterium]|nr:HEAT repeat domain-containing protein [Deltaproteobacteria bacterium]
MPLRNRILAVTALITVAAVVGSMVMHGAVSRRASKPGEAAAQSESLLPLRVRWPAGVRTIYGVEWTARTHGLVAPTQLEQAKRLAFEAETQAEIAVDGLGEAGGEMELALSYASVKTFDFRMAGRSATTDAGKAGESLRGQRALLRVSDRGELRSIAFEPGTSPEVKSALKALAQELGFTLAPGGEQQWEAEEPVSLGVLQVRYTRHGEVVQRTPVAFKSLDAVRGALDGKQELEGGASVRVDDQGLAAILDTESWSYTRRGMNEPSIATAFEFKLERLRTETIDPLAIRAALGKALPQPLGKAIVDDGLAARRDARLAEKMSAEKLVTFISDYDRGAKPEHGLFTSAGAFLRLHPEELPGLVERFQDKGTGSKGRGFVLDLLAEAGDAKAQGALVQALGSKAARADSKEYGMLVQRLAFVGEPTPETAKYLEDELARAKRSSDVETQQGAATALGAMANRMIDAGRKDEARAALEELRGQLRDATSNEVRLGLLAGLGNGAQAEDVPALNEFAASDDPKVRSQVASSLRAINDPGARETLLKLAADGSAGVASSAFAALNQQKLGGDEWGLIASLVNAGKIVTGADANLINLVRLHRREAGPLGDQILRALLARNSAPDNDLGSTIRGMLGDQG